MLKCEKTVAIFWLLVSVIICLKSFNLGVGTTSNPGPGFMPLIAGAIIGLLGLVLFFQALRSKQRQKTEEESKIGIKLYPMVPVLFILVAYSVSLKWLGYLLSTFSLVFFLILIGRAEKKWGFVIVVTFLTTLLSYLVFCIWLQCPLPKGKFFEILGI